jgi:hypothetical protein
MQYNSDAVLLGGFREAIAAAVLDLAQDFLPAFTPFLIVGFLLLFQPFAVAFSFTGSQFEGDKRIIVYFWYTCSMLCIDCI